MMDRANVRASAEALEQALIRHAGANEDVDALAHMLAPLIAAAKAGAIVAPVPWSDIPGDYPFREGYYDDFPDVSAAYARFKVVLSGSERLLDGLTDGPG